MTEKVKDILDIRNYTDNDREKVVRLLSLFFDEVGCAERWQAFYQGGPSGDPVRIVAEDRANETIFGHYSVLRMPLNMFGKRVNGAKGEGAIVDPAALRLLLKQGIKPNRSILYLVIEKALKSAFFSGIEIICSNPNNLALRAHAESGHITLKHKFTIFSFPISERYWRYLLTKIIKVGIIATPAAMVLSNLLKFLYFLKTGFTKKGKIKLIPIEKFGIELENLQSDFLKSSNCITMERSCDYFNWRFKEDDYKKFLVNLDGKVIGYVIIRIFTNPNGFKEASLTDYLFAPKYWRFFRDAITGIIGFSKSQGCDFLHIDHMHDYKENLGIYNMLKNLFFISRPDKRNIVIFLSDKFKSERYRIMNIENWFFTNLYFGAF